MADEDDDLQCQKIEDALQRERGEWNSTMASLIDAVMGVEGLAEAQVKMLSYRHIMTDKIAFYKNALNSRKSKDAVFKSIRQSHYETRTDRKFTDKRVADLVSADMSARSRKCAIIQTHIDYLAEAVQTLDKMGYAIRNRIEIENLKMA